MVVKDLRPGDREFALGAQGGLFWWTGLEDAPCQPSLGQGDGHSDRAGVHPRQRRGGGDVPGPGRPWQPGDGNDPPGNGGCGYMYQHVNASPVTARLAITWAVNWVGSDGTAGTLPTMTTQAQTQFLVEQIQIVNR